ncbi:MAG: pyruvate formate-lyase-activating protein [Erysipelotrichales bacterium]
MVKGYINQFESMGNLDGPGTRFVMFMQGCMLRCKYCHNPETFILKRDTEYEYTSDEVVDKVLALKSYYLNGGVTISGGEPLLQIDFIIDVAKKLKKAGLHVAIDTSGAPYDIDNKEFMDKLETLIEYVDLFLVDIKHIDNDKCLELTNFGNKNTLSFIQYLNEKKKSIWIRYVLINGITDKKEDLIETGKFINSIEMIENVDILAYHNMAEAKWAQEGLKYQLTNVAPTSKDEVNKAYQVMFNL